MVSVCTMISRLRRGTNCSLVCMKGSSVEPNFEVVRRTPLATARIRPWSAVRRTIMRSSSASLEVRRIITWVRSLWENYVPEPRDLRDVLLLSWCLSFYITQIAVDRRCDGLQRGRGGVMIQTNPPQDSVTNGSLHIG